MKLIVFILATFSILGCADPSTKIFPAEHWIESKSEKVGVNAQTLNKAVEFLELNSGRDGSQELMIIRGGSLIYKGDSINKVHGVWSCTKSFTSTILGLLIGDKKTQLKTLAKEIIPEMAGAYPNVSLLNFATMTSGYKAEGDTVKKGYTHGPSATPFTPSTQPLFEPGTKYAYWDAAMNQFANVLTQIAKQPLDEFFQQRIADPIGMNENNWYWENFGEVNGLKIVGGAGNRSKGIFISASELARFGLLFLNEGNWNGNQLIDRDWIRQSTKVQVLPTMALGTHLSEISGQGVYGFNWWVNGVQPDGSRPWPNAPATTYAASGFNNNKMFIIPEWDIVVVRLGLDAKDIVITDLIWNEFLRIVGESIES